MFYFPEVTLVVWLTPCLVVFGLPLLLGVISLMVRVLVQSLPEGHD